MKSKHVSKPKAPRWSDYGLRPYCKTPNSLRAEKKRIKDRRRRKELRDLSRKLNRNKKGTWAVRFKFEARISVHPTLETMNQFLHWLKQPISDPMKLGGLDGAGAIDAVASIHTDSNGVPILTLVVDWLNTPTDAQYNRVIGAIRGHIDAFPDHRFRCSARYRSPARNAGARRPGIERRSKRVER